VHQGWGKHHAPFGIKKREYDLFDKKVAFYCLNGPWFIEIVMF
jgi:hypothetical protein